MSSKESTTTPTNNKGFDRHIALPLAQKEVLLAFAMRKFDLVMKHQEDLSDDSRADLWTEVLTLNAAVNEDKLCEEASDTKIWRACFAHTFVGIMEEMDARIKEDTEEARAHQSAIRKGVPEGLCKDLGIDADDLALVDVAPMKPPKNAKKEDNSIQEDDSRTQQGSKVE